MCMALLLLFFTVCQTWNVSSLWGIAFLRDEQMFGTRIGNGDSIG